MVQKVVIIGQGYTGRLGIVRSVAEIGCEVIVIAMVGYKKDGRSLRKNKTIDGSSKYVSKVYYCYAKDKRGLLKILLEKCADSNQKVVIIPDNDFSASVVDMNLNVLEKHFYCPNINHKEGAITTWMDKKRQKELASDLGIKVTSSLFVEVKNRSYQLPDNIKYPCFAKPLVSMGRKASLAKCNNRMELCKHLDFVGLNEDLKMLVEEFKDISNEYAVLGVSDGSNVIIPGVIKILSLAHGSHFGVAARGEVVPVTGYENIVEKFKVFIQRIGFVGIFDFDFYESNGDYFFGELNLRFGGSGYAYTKQGVNIPAIFVKRIVGESIDGFQTEIEESATYVNERMCVDDWYNGYISTEKYYELLNSSKIKFIEDDVDPDPQKVFRRNWRRLFIRKAIKKMLGMQK